jgi:ferredoxin
MALPFLPDNPLGHGFQNIPRSGLNAAVYNVDGVRITDFKKWANELCPALRATAKGQEYICAVAHQNIAARAIKTGKTVVDECDAGLMKFAVPIFVADEFLGVADLHLIMDPAVVRRTDFQSSNSAAINHELCTECGPCREMCRFAAISADYIVDLISCEGCGVCVDFCPEKAIDFPQNT